MQIPRRSNAVLQNRLRFWRQSSSNERLVSERLVLLRQRQLDRGNLCEASASPHAALKAADGGQ